MWKGLQEFFVYTKSQRAGIYLLLLLIFGIQVYLYFYDRIHPPSPLEVSIQVDSTIFRGRVHSYASANGAPSPSARSTEPPAALFNFDPNSVQARELEKLGMSAAQARAFVRYRSSGAVFRRPSDMLKAYVVDSHWYAKVRPYVKIESDFREIYQVQSKADSRWRLGVFNPNEVDVETLENMGLYQWQAQKILQFRRYRRPYYKAEDIYRVKGIDSALALKLVPFIRIDSIAAVHKRQFQLNVVDSATLAATPGLSAYDAQRILRYRDRLGGFYHREQLAEVYGMDSVKISRLSPFVLMDSVRLRKLNINRASFKELLQHPYLEYEMVQSMVNYREQIGPYQEVAIVRNIPGMNDVLFRKIAKYLTAD